MDSRPDERDDRQAGAVHELLPVPMLHLPLPLAGQKVRIPGKNKAEDNDARLGDDVHRAQDFVHQGRLPHAPDVEPDEKERDDDRLQTPDDGHVVERPNVDGDRSQRREEEIYIPGGSDGKKSDVNRVVEQQGRTGDETPEIPQSPQGEILPTAGNRVSRSQFGIGQADHDVDEAGQGKSGYRPPCVAAMTNPRAA